MNFTPDDVLRAARSHMGVKYVHNGRHPTLGLDCVGLPALVAMKLGYDIVDVPIYSHKPDGKLLERLAINGDRVPITIMAQGSRRKGDIPNDDIRPSDVGVFWVDPVTRVPQHAGIFSSWDGGVAGLGLIHCEMHVEKVVEHPLDRTWRYRLLAVLRWRGITWPH